MFNDNKGFFKTLLDKIKSSVKSSLNIKNNKIMITKGFYQTKASLNTDSKEIIRIIGADINRLANWMTQDGKSIPEYVLEQEYVPLDMQPNKDAFKINQKNQEKLKNILAGIGSEDDVEEVIEDEYPLNNDEDIVVNVPNKYPEKTRTFVEKSKVDPKVQEVQIILDKINIDNINKKNQEKFGESNLKKKTIQISIPLELNYDFDKLKTTIQLLDLDLNIVVDMIVKGINIDISRNIRQSLVKMLSETEQNSEITPFFKPIEQINEHNSQQIVGPGPTKIQSQSLIEDDGNKIKLNLGMNELENFFNTYTKK